MARRPSVPPAHIGVLAGLSTAAYAVTLAAVTGVQSGAEAATRLERAPTVAALAAMTAEGDRLAVRLERAGAAYESASGAYRAAGLAVGRFEERLAALSSAVSKASGSAASLPATVKLPRVSRSVAVAKAPPTQATTRASGG